MRKRGWIAAVGPIVMAWSWASLGADGPVTHAEHPKKVLVELYTSQGSRACPPASDLLGRLAKLGYGPDRVVVLNFHVDDHDGPWIDPYADAVAGRRRRNYGAMLERRDLEVTPLMIVNGRDPLVGSDRSATVVALSKAGRTSAGVDLDLSMIGNGPRKTLQVRVAGRSDAVEGRELVIGVAIAEDPVTTKVLAGENAGRSLVERQVVRRFVQRAVTTGRLGPQTVTIPVELPEGGDPSRFRVAAFVQDHLDGTVYQAESIPWAAPGHAHHTPSKPKARRPKFPVMNFVDLTPLPYATGTATDDTPPCPDCGTPLTLEYLSLLPPGYSFGNRGRFPNVPPPMC